MLVHLFIVVFYGLVSRLSFVLLFYARLDRVTTYHPPPSRPHMISKILDTRFVIHCKLRKMITCHHKCLVTRRKKKPSKSIFLIPHLHGDGIESLFPCYNTRREKNTTRGVDTQLKASTLRKRNNEF